MPRPPAERTPGSDPAAERTARFDKAIALAAEGFDIGQCYGVTSTGGCLCGRADCKASGKHGGLGWKEHATQNPDTIRTRFATGDPNYMVIPPKGSGLLIVDEDVPGALDTRGDVPTTMIDQTGERPGGGRGRHLYGRLPDEISEADLPYQWEGGEIRFGGNGGVVGPLCRHASGVTYDPLNGFAVETLPEPWVRELIASGRKRTSEQDAARSPGDPDWTIAEPRRHPWLTTMAGRLRRDGLGGDALRDGLRYLNGQRCSPPLPATEVDEIAAWADTKEGGPGLDAEPRAGLRFYTPAEVASTMPSEPDWIARPGLLAVGAITEIDGKVKAAGKTTLILHTVRPILDGAPFLGRPTRRSRVVYVTEQSRQTFIDALRRAGLDQRGDELQILFREDIGATRWADVVAGTALDGYDVVVFDTLGKLAGIKQENEAGEWAAAMSPLQDLAASGRAVIVARHDRKSGGDVGDSGRGSSQASGDVDIILAVRRPEGNQPSNRRVIESLSRYAETPEKIVVELTDHGYVLLGTDEAVAVSDARAFLSAAIGMEYRQNGTGLDMEALVGLGKESNPVLRRTTIQTAVEEMVRSAEIAKKGRGVKGDPFVYSPADPEGLVVLPELGTYNGGKHSGAVHGPVPDDAGVSPTPVGPSADLVDMALHIFGDMLTDGPAEAEESLSWRCWVGPGHQPALRDDGSVYCITCHPATVDRSSGPKAASTRRPEAV